MCPTHPAFPTHEYEPGRITPFTPKDTVKNQEHSINLNPRIHGRIVHSRDKNIKQASLLKRQHVHPMVQQSCLASAPAAA